MVFQLIYTCALSAEYGSNELEKIATDSRDHNLKHGITGILICNDGSVLQVLEGDRKIVEDLFSRILKDDRVKNTLVLIRRTLSKREFPNWSMGYRDASQSDFMFDLTTESLSSTFSKALSLEINAIGRTFARVNGMT